VGPLSITGKIYEDVNGDSKMIDAVGRPSAGVTLYRDGGDGLPDGGDDSLIATVTTDASGNYNFSNLGADHYWVVVDSKTIEPSAGFRAGFDLDDVWAEQTYGDNSYTTALDKAARFGGRNGDVSDNAGALASAEHVALVVLSSADVSGVDFGFSFNVVTHTRGGDNSDDDTSAARTIQGSLRQFLQNANAIAKANAMRFVPAVATNASGGGGSWWQVAVTLDLPDVLDVNTTIDGTAYSLFNGTSLRDENPGLLGAGGTVGVASLALPTLGRPELEILDSNNRNIGLDLQANNATVRHLAIYGFGDGQNNDGEANIRVGAFNGTLIEACVIGANAGSFTAPAEVDTADNIRVVGGDNGTIRNNLIGFSGGNGIGCKTSANGWVIEGNEIRGNASQHVEMNGISLETSSSATIRGNLIMESQGAGIDTLSSTGAHTIENNTITRNGTGTIETPGIRLYGIGTTVDRNRIYENYGAGVMVTKDATQNIITQNSIYDNGTIGAASGQVGIDLTSGGDQKAGDSPFVTLNDSSDGDSGGNDLFNFPILESAQTSGGNLILTGFARPDSIIEFFIADEDPSGFGEGRTYLTTLTEDTGSDLDDGTGSYGPGAINNLLQGSDNTNRFRFEIPLPAGVIQGTMLTATATLLGSTSEFSGLVPVNPPRIFGTIYEDPNGDASVVDGQPQAGLTVTLYRDGGDGNADGVDDGLVITTTTDGNGDYLFSALYSGTYWIVVDSKEITPSAGFTGSGDLEDIWAEQTYGDDPTTPTLDVAARFGGRNGGVSDNAAALASAQHIARVVLSSADVSGVDFGFSFNVVTNTRGGDNTDDDGSAVRTIQGSLRQFMDNANAIANANAMRFVPAVATNASGGGGAWWQVAVSEDLPDIDDTNTTIDGTAYNLADGTSLRDENPGVLGTGGNVGVDDLAVTTLNRPEFEILDSNNKNIGLDILANNAIVRRLAISGFGDAQNNDGEANIRIGEVSGTLIEECVIGTSAAGFTAPAEVDTADNIRALKGGSGTIRNNLIGFSGGNGISVKENTAGWLIVGNEIRGNAHQNTELNGISFEKSSGMTVRGNLIADSNGAGVDMKDSTGSNTFENNTVTGNGTGTVETPGIRLYGTGSTIDRNVIYENFGAGLMVIKSAIQNTITQNSFYDNGTIGAGSGQIGIDLLVDGDDDKTGDSPFFTLNDPDDGDANGLLNFPVIETADIGGSGLTLTGFARPGSVIEFFIAAADPSGFGEGKTYIVTQSEGSGDDSDATTGHYGPGAVNGIVQGEDTTNRFQFLIPVPAGVTVGTVLTATATLAGSTSEFSGNITVIGIHFVDILVLKSAQTFSDPVNGTTNPKAIPGASVIYTIGVTNQGNRSTDTDTVAITDAVPVNTSLFVGDLDGSGSPVDFSDGAVPSGLSYTFTSIGDLNDDVEFSIDGTNYDYNPGPDADPDSFNSNVTHMRVNPKGVFNGASGGNNPSFELKFKVRVE
jgi:parallel beta-helix repeat protein